MEPLSFAEAARRVGVKRDTFFRRVLVSDADVQQQMLARISDELQELLEREDATLWTDFFPTALRLSLDAPFPAIREALAQVVDVVEGKFPQAQELRKRQTRVSHFFPNGDAPEDAEAESVPSVSAEDDDELRALFQTSFLRTGRVTHLMQILAWHPSYLALFDRSLAATMTRDGTLPLQWRSYIAVMGASELRCHYLADLQQYNFVVNGGDGEWIKGLDYLPPKLFRLHELSSLLAHRPWLLTAEHVAELLRSDQDDSWSVSELVHAIIVLCQAHSMASIALGVGCSEEVDLAVFGQFGYALDAESAADGVDNQEAADASSCSSVDLSTIDRDDDMLLKQLKKNSGLDSDTADEEEETVDEQEQQEDEDDDEEEEYGQDDGFEVVVDEADYGINASTASRRKDTLWRFCGGSVIRYADFDVRSENYEVLHTEDFSWDEHCFSLVKRYFPGEAGQILEDLFNLTNKLTYDYIGAQKEECVDTSPYRDAVWYYVHRIFGICHDDYDYRQVNTYLNRPTKIFLKKVACTPWKVHEEDFAHFDRTLSPSEKCHVILLVAEARKQAGLMYGLRAVMNHMR
ncbi:Sestrin-like protein [Phytophthora megakarya]|uniref:Sestrin-like protein n=1 Tax=Phytophthora megakarya TaxID=4795 RepID=A0A225WRY8_9STRA|nr:Sestrin-like protein [Phytophthora megakarya]